MSIIVTKSPDGSATFDSSYQYRYSLTRSWNTTRSKPLTFIMLNPSKADAEHNDPTVFACIQFAKELNYDHLDIVNLFAYRSSLPSDLRLANDPIGTDNDHYLLKSAELAKQIILAWGNWGCFLNRHEAVLQLLRPHQQKLYYLKRNHSGQPGHPLYIKRNTQPQPWTTVDMNK